MKYNAQFNDTSEGIKINRDGQTYSSEATINSEANIDVAYSLKTPAKDEAIKEMLLNLAIADAKVKELGIAIGLLFQQGLISEEQFQTAMKESSELLLGNKGRNR